MSGWVGLDWGSKKVGFASSDAEGIVVTPQGIWTRQGHKNPWVLGSEDFLQLTKLMEDYDPQAWILGWPRNLGGLQTDSARGAETLAVEITKFTKLPVHLVDESLSSWDAQQRQKFLGRSGKKIPEDAWAAASLLEDFLRLQSQVR